MSLAKKLDWNGFFIFILGLIFFTVASNKAEVIGFESRFYLFALEMWRHGPTWFATTYHQPYPDYPGTSTFIIYLIAKLIGELSRFSAVLPSAFVSALTMMVTYLIGAYYNKRWGISAVCFLLLTYSFVAEARTISLDQYITLVTALCFYLAMCRRYRWIYPLFILGFAMRGPIGFIISASIVSMFYLLDRNFKEFFITSFVASLLFVIACMLLLGLAYLEDGKHFVSQIINMQAVDRLQEVINLPWHYYFTEGLAPYSIAYPLAILGIFGMAYVPKNDKAFLFKLLAWAAIILIGLSIPTNKKIRYLLPFTPALALLCGYFYINNTNNRYYSFLRSVVLYICLLLPIICVVALVLIKNKYLEFVLNYTNLIEIFLLIQILMFIAYFKSQEKYLLVLLLASFCFLTSYIGVVEPISFSLNKTHLFVAETEQLREQSNAHLVFYRENRDGVAIKYLANMSKDDEPNFIENPYYLLEDKKRFIVLTSRKNYEDIPVMIKTQMRIISKGNLGRKEFIVFTKIIGWH